MGIALLLLVALDSLNRVFDAISDEDARVHQELSIYMLSVDENLCGILAITLHHSQYPVRSLVEAPEQNWAT